jgi:hypothetical protein
MVCFERGARIDSFAAVLTMLGWSSMYEVICVRKYTLSWWVTIITICEYMCDWFHFFLRRLKINHKAPSGHMHLFLTLAPSRTLRSAIRGSKQAADADWVLMIIYAVIIIIYTLPTQLVYCRPHNYFTHMSFHSLYPSTLKITYFINTVIMSCRQRLFFPISRAFLTYPPPLPRDWRE